MFKGGCILQKKERWLDSLRFLQSQGVSPKPFIRQAIQDNGIDVLSKEWTNQKPPFKFRLQSFQSKESLLDASFPNSPAVHIDSELVWAEIRRLVDARVVREVDRADALGQGSVVNPLHWFSKKRDDGTVKNRLVMQPLVNAFYTSPKFSLPDIVNELGNLAALEELEKDDMRDCFYGVGSRQPGRFSGSSTTVLPSPPSYPPLPHQYPVTQSSSRLLRFMMIGESGEIHYFEFLTLIMGISCASYCVQHLNEVVTAAFSIKHRAYINVYTDDFFSDGKAGKKFESFASDFGFIFKDDKKVSGSSVSVLGAHLDLSSKTASLDRDKAASLELIVRETLKHENISPSELASLAGKLEFASRFSVDGRGLTFHITQLLSKASWEPFSSRDAWLKSTDRSISISAGTRGELLHWSTVTTHQRLDMVSSASTFIGTISSDASSKGYGYTIGDRFFGGTFPDDVASLNISQKESFALATLVDKLVDKNKAYTIKVDNSAVVAAFRKGRSSDAYIHSSVCRAKLALRKLGSSAEVVWISTKEMESLADGPSRNSWPQDPYGLSPGGADRLLDRSPELRRRLDNGDLVELFSGPSNNPLGIEYFSPHVNFDDPRCRGEDAFSALARKRANNQSIDGGVYAFPPFNLCLTFCDQVASLGLGTDSAVFLVTAGTLLQQVFNRWNTLGSFDSRFLCSGRARGWSFRSPGTSLVLITLKSSDPFIEAVQ